MEKLKVKEYRLVCKSSHSWVWKKFIIKYWKLKSNLFWYNVYVFRWILHEKSHTNSLIPQIWLVPENTKTHENSGRCYFVKEIITFLQRLNTQALSKYWRFSKIFIIRRRGQKFSLSIVGWPLLPNQRNIVSKAILA